MAQYKLIYFDLRGRAELARFILIAAGQEFEDKRVDKDEWETLKPSTPFGQLPLLEVTEGSNKATIAQSLAIARFLARKFNLDGKNDIEKGEVDMYADQISDLLAEMVKVHSEADETKKKELEEKLRNDIMPQNFKFFEARLESRPSGFLVGDSLTWVDLYFIVIKEWLNEKKDAVLAHFAKVKEHDEKIRSLPKIAEWIGKRPVTPL